MQRKAVISKLSEIGLSEYEAKAYLALIAQNPATAYEIGKSSGIPSSKIYEVLAKLSEKGMIQVLNEDRRRTSKTTRYVPQNPDDFLSRYANGVGRLVDSLRTELKGVNGKPQANYIWNINDHDRLIERARQMIDSAQSVILLSLWKEELAFLLGDLKAAEERGVKSAIVHFGPPQTAVGQIYYHPIEDTLYAEKGGRGFVLVVDSAEVLMGTISYEGKTEGAWSKNRGFTMIAEDYVKHDVYITKILKRFNRELVATFGENYVKLRDVLHD